MVKNIRKKLLKTIFLITIIVMIIIPKQEIATSNIMLGDINDDKIVDSRDMLYILRHIATKVNKKHPEWELKEEKLEAADVTKDGKVDAEDMLLVLRYIAASNSETIKNKHPEWIEFKKKETVKEIKEQEIKQQETKQEEKTKQEQETKQEETKQEETKQEETKQEETKQEETKQEETKQEETKQEETKQEETKQEETKKQEEQTTKPETKTIEVTGIKIDKTKLEIEEGKTEKIKATVEPTNATNKEIKYSSSNTKIVTVDDNGNVKGIKTGAAVITATADNGKKAECKVTVKTKEIEATDIKVSRTDATLTGNTARLVSIILPYNVTKRDVEWTNSNPASVAIEKEIEAGTYYLKTALDDKKVIDIRGSGAKVQIYNKQNIASQQFIITKVEEGYYTIKSKKSNKVLDVKNGGQTAGTIVQEYQSNGTDAQKWEFEYAGNGYYYIKSKWNGLYLDVKGGKSDNGTQIQVYTENRNKSQKFKLEVIKKNAIIVPEGTYYLKTALDNNKVVEVKGGSKENDVKIQINKNSKSNGQKFELLSAGNNYYIIRAKCSNRAFDVPNGTKTSGTQIQQHYLNGTDAQLWKLESAGNGYYYIKSKCNGLYLDVKGGKTTNGTAIQVQTGNKSNAQKFKLEKTGDTINKNISIVTIKSKGRKDANGKAIITVKTTSNNKSAKCTVTVSGGYWEAKSGKYIYHYLNGTTKTWTVSEYEGRKKLKEKNVKALDPKTFVKKGNMFTFAGITQKYYVEDNTANNIAIKNGGSPYAITVDLNRRHESIFKMNKGDWEPYKSAEVHVGKKWTNYNSKGCPDLKTYTKNSVTPTGLFYITGNRNNGKGLYWVGFGVQYKNKNLGAYGVNGHGPNKEDYLHSGEGKNYTVKKGGPCTNGCVVSSLAHAKWIYFNCGRGTPVLIY